MSRAIASRSRALPHLPLLRAGRPYRSLETRTLHDLRSGEPVAEVSQAIPGLIARDLASAGDRHRRLAELPVAELLAICSRAADLFANATLPLGEEEQDPDAYLGRLAATAGMPRVMGRANLDKLASVLREMPTVLGGLTRGLDLTVLDGGWGEQDGRHLSYVPLATSLGAVLPNNSPGVHGVWLPALALKMPLALRPGSQEPWTPYRLAQAFLAAGCPPEAWSLYPSGHAGGNEIVLRTERSLFFGDARTVAGWRGTGQVQVHGPGWSKVVFAPDAAWRDHLDLVVESVVANGGRSCTNASGVWTSYDGEALALELAERLAAIPARGLEDPDARLAAFADPRSATAISQAIDRAVAQGGAEEMTARSRQGDRVARVDGATFLLPTVIFTRDPDHPLARAEYPFPFVTVVEVPPERLLPSLGSTLVATVISGDQLLLRRAQDLRQIDRLNLGPIATPRIAWDQPHEGNLFDHLYRRRAFQAAPLSA